ncbi:MAG: hypothetical protein IPJ13_23255 [Saprospiraceae bacterium]|nr:hypothetical protein [Saprospiraceae bacterium]
MEVSPDGPAEKSGLKQGMNIIAVNGKPIAFQHEFRKALQDFKGKNTAFTVITATSDTLTKQIAVSDEGKIGIAMEQLRSIFGEIWSFDPFLRVQKWVLIFLAISLSIWTDVFWQNQSERLFGKCIFYRFHV